MLLTALRAGCEDKETSALWESRNLVCLATKVINGCVPVISATASASLHSSPAAGGGDQEGTPGSGFVCSWWKSGAEKGTCPLHLPLHLENCPVCSGHCCNLNNIHLILSSSYLAVVLFSDALLRGHKKGQMLVRLESFNLNQPPPTHY